MFTDRRSSPSFDICHGVSLPGCLLAGISRLGLVRLIAVEFLFEHLDFEETG